MDFGTLVVLGVYGVGVYILIKYILPSIWKNIIIPLGKAAYIGIIFASGIIFFVALKVLQETELPQETQVFIAIITGTMVGVKWAKKKL